MRSPHTPDTRLRDPVRLHEGQVRPDATGAPAWGLGLELVEPWEQGRIALGDLERSAPRQPHGPSRLLNSHVSAPTSVFRLAFSRAKRASLWLG